MTKQRSESSGKRGRLQRPEWRPLFLVLQTLATLTVVGLLAYQAVDAARSQRHTAEQVLHDYAGLAANRFVSRFTTQWIYQAIDPIYKAFLATPWSQLPEVTDISPSTAQELVIAICRMDLSHNSVWSNGPHSSAFFTREFSNALQTNSWPEDAFFFVLSSPSDPDILFFFHFPDGNVNRNRVAGFTTSRQRMQPFFDRMAKRPIMPVSLGEEALDNRHLKLDVLGPQQHLLFSSGTISDGIRFEQHWERGLASWTIRVTLDPNVADQLIIGGLPSSRLPTLMVLLALASGLVLLTWWQWQREGQLNQRQTDSLVAISHELRTPLAQIAMFSETLLLDRVRSADERRRSLQIIHGESQRLTHLVDNAVYFSLSLHQPNRVQASHLHVSTLFEEQIDFFHSIVDNLGTTFKLSLEGDPVVLADAVLLQRILRNLIDNALKYGPMGQTITLGATANPKCSRIWVEDEGEGISNGERDLIWQRFERLSRHRQSAVAGNGIGLWLVQRMVHAQGGEVWVEAGEAGGARFVMLFPCLPPGASDLSGINPGGHP